jgi:hypothetical protein
MRGQITLGATLLLLLGCTRGEPIQEVGALAVTVDDDSCTAVADVEVGIGACDRLLPPSVDRDGAIVRVELEVETSDDTCILLLVGEDVRVGLGRFDAGEYDVVVEAELGERRARFAIPASCR